jgi:hypothetical protein
MSLYITSTGTGYKINSVGSSDVLLPLSSFVFVVTNQIRPSVTTTGTSTTINPTGSHDYVYPVAPGMYYQRTPVQSVYYGNTLLSDFHV